MIDRKRRKSRSIDLVAVDIGNTNTHLGFFSRGRMLSKNIFKTAGSAQRTIAQIKKSARGPNKVEVVIASVVAGAGVSLKKRITRKLKLKTYLAGRDLGIPIVNRYRRPGETGVDRLLAAYAAFSIYRRGLVVVNCGTAITFDAVTKGGVYLGGAIAPGIRTCLDSLAHKADQLPKIVIKRPTSAMGQSTAECMRVGCSFGVGGLCDRIIDEIEKAAGHKFFVVATGGDASFIQAYSGRINHIEPDLVLKGIAEVHKKNIA